MEIDKNDYILFFKSNRSIIFNWKSLERESIFKIKKSKLCEIVKNNEKPINKKKKLYKLEVNNEIYDYELNFEKLSILNIKSPYINFDITMNQNQILLFNDIINCNIKDSSIPELSVIKYQSFHELKKIFTKDVYFEKIKFEKKTLNIPIKIFTNFFNNNILRYSFKKKKSEIEIEIQKIIQENIPKIKEKKNDIFNYEKYLLLSMNKKNFYTDILIICTSEDSIKKKLNINLNQEMEKNLFKRIFDYIFNPKIEEYNSIPYLSTNLYLSFEYLGEKSFYYLYKNGYLINNEIKVYKNIFIENTKYLKYINGKNNSINYCNSFLLTNLNIKKLILNNENISSLSYKRIIMEITIGKNKKNNNVIYLCKNLNLNFDDDKVLIRIGAIIQIYKIEEKEIKKGTIITFIYARLLSFGWEGLWHQLIQLMNEKIELNLFNYKFGKVSFENPTILNKFCLYLKENNKLKELNISKNQIGKFSFLSENIMKNFFEALKENKSLHKLNLAHNELGLYSLKNKKLFDYICDFIIGNKTLQKLNISSNDIGSSSIKNINIIKNLCLALEINNTLQKLDLSNNDFGNSFIEKPVIINYFCDFLEKNKSLKKIDLSNNQLGLSFLYDELIVKNICYALEKNNFLQNINLSNNFLGPISTQNPNIMKIIFEKLKNNKTLLKINLSKNEFGSSSIGNPDLILNICEFLKINNHLISLDLSYNELGNSLKFITSLFSAIITNKTLKIINLSSNQLFHSYVKDQNLLVLNEFFIILKENLNLEEINLSSNELKLVDSILIKTLNEILKNNIHFKSLNLSGNYLAYRNSFIEKIKM